jgi:hypothetical protein
MLTMNRRVAELTKSQTRKSQTRNRALRVPHPRMNNKNRTRVKGISLLPHRTPVRRIRKPIRTGTNPVNNRHNRRRILRNQKAEVLRHLPVSHSPRIPVKSHPRQESESVVSPDR